MTHRLATILTILLFGCGQSRLDNFERLIFHSGPCFGTCPTFHLQLEGNKDILLHVESVYKDNGKLFGKIDSSRLGHFIGRANDTTFRKLLSQLKEVTFDEDSFEGPMYTCGPEITIVWSANGRRRFFQSSHPAPEAMPVIWTLYEICETSTVRRTGKSFKIDDESAR